MGNNLQWSSKIHGIEAGNLRKCEHNSRIKGYFSWITRDLFNNWPFIFVFMKVRKLPTLLKIKLLFRLLVMPCKTQPSSSSSLTPYIKTPRIHTACAARPHALLCSQQLSKVCIWKQMFRVFLSINYKKMSKSLWWRNGFHYFRRYLTCKWIRKRKFFISFCQDATTTT